MLKEVHAYSLRSTGCTTGVYIYIYICTYIYVYMYIHIHIHVHVHIRTCVYIYVYMRIPTNHEQSYDNELEALSLDGTERVTTTTHSLMMLLTMGRPCMHHISSFGLATTQSQHTIR